MTVETETLVIGAGPAGTAAATILARAGREVLVVDKARFPRDKCCGDGLTALALRELEALGLVPQPTTPSEFGKLIASETEKWGKVVKSAGLKAGR